MEETLEGGQDPPWAVAPLEEEEVTRTTIQPVDHRVKL